MSIFDKPKYEVEKFLKSLGSKIEKQLKSVGHTLEAQLKKTGSNIEHDLNSVGHEIEGQLHEVGDEIKASFHAAFSELIELAEQGVLQEAFEKMLGYLEKEISHGDAPITWRTAYLDIEVADAKHFARVLRGILDEGLPTSKTAWRHIIVDLAPTAVHPKIGVPFISVIAQRIPLDDLERSALDTLLQEAGL